MSEPFQGANKHKNNSWTDLNGTQPWLASWVNTCANPPVSSQNGCCERVCVLSLVNPRCGVKQHAACGRSGYRSPARHTTRAFWRDLADLNKAASYLFVCVCVCLDRISSFAVCVVMCVTGHQSRLDCCGAAAESGRCQVALGEREMKYDCDGVRCTQGCVCVQPLLACVPVWMNERGWWASPVVAGATAGCFFCSVRLKWSTPRRKQGTFKIQPDLSNLVFNLLNLDLIVHKGNVVSGDVQKDISPPYFFPFPASDNFFILIYESPSTRIDAD